MYTTRTISDSLRISHTTSKSKRRRNLDAEHVDDCSDLSTRRSKRVRFETIGPETDAVKTHERFIDIFRSEFDKPNMWWSRQERLVITDTCHEKIDDFRRDHIDRVRHFVSVFDQCQETPSQATSDLLEKATISLPAHIRGLEWGWAPSIASHRKSHTKEVIKAQKHLQSLSPEMRERVLSSRSLRSSRPGRVLARLLAECDERGVIRDTLATTVHRRNRCRMILGW